MKDGKTERERFQGKEITKNIPYTEAPSIGGERSTREMGGGRWPRFRVSTDFVKIPARDERAEL